LLETGVFLDRDDTILKDIPYLSDPDKVELMPGASEAISLLNEKGIPAIIITNQSGIARGLFDERALQTVHERLITILAENSARIDAIYFCPHYPDGIIKKYALICHCRKPETGLLENAAADFLLKLNRCYFIGDKKSDMEAIRRVGGKGVLAGKRTGKVKSDYNAKDILDAVKWIIKDIKRQESGDKVQFKIFFKTVSYLKRYMVFPWFCKGHFL
jgi:D-glycero-D-manno-heptose 1,7-bisphosphate phosphatase